MVGTICPMVHGAHTKRDGNNVLMIYTAGSLMGAALTGAVAGAFGSLVFGRFDRHRTIALSVMAFLCILYLLDELGVVQLPHLQSHKRVPASWRLWRHYRAAGLYGLVLGVGVGTPIPLSVFYIALAWCIVIGDPVISALAFLGFGVGRALPIVLLSRVQIVGGPSNLMDSVCWKLPLIRLVNKCALTFSASVLLCNSIRS